MKAEEEKKKPKQRPLGRGYGKRISDEKIKAIEVLYFEKGMTMPEISKQLNVSDGTVSKYARLANEKMKD